MTSGDSSMIEQLTSQLGKGGSIPTSPLHYSVRSIPRALTHTWLLHKHYAKRIPQIQYAFGLYADGTHVGVCTFGWACRGMQDKYAPVVVMELNRLVLNDGIRNGASRFVSHCLKLLPPRPCYVVSYADSNQNHHGYIYQALNGIYTGLSSSERKVYIAGKLMHRRTLNAVYGTSSIGDLSTKYDVEVEEQEGKHRYFFLLGDKRQRRVLLDNLGFDVLPYPKGDNAKYDANYEPTLQGVLI